MQVLTSYINQVYAIADLRNLAVENPVPVRYQLENGEVLIVVVSHLEPNNVTLPFNVLWIVADPNSSNFMNMYRRISAFPEGEFRNTWQRIHTMEQALIEHQYWDLSDGLSLGEVEVPQVGAATVDVRGLIKLNRTYVADERRPVVVELADSRNTDARPPAQHEHPLQPVTMLHGAGGIEEHFVKIATINDPKAGDILVNSVIDVDGNAVAMWRKPLASDLTYDGPMLESLEIKGPSSNEIDELTPFTFRADAIFSDGSRIVDAPVSWLIIGGNTEVATIGGVSGNFISIDVNQEETVRVQAAYTQVESGLTVTEFVDIKIKDATEYLELERIEIVGLTSVDENTKAAYTVQAYFNDGTDSGVTPKTFTSSNPSAGQFDPDTGVLTVGELSENHQTVISASYEYRGVTKAASLNVTAKDLTIYPEHLEIIGPDTVDENTEVNFSIRVTFTDSTMVTLSDSDWASSNEMAGVIDGNGLFTAAEELREDISTTLSASYTLEGKTVSGTKTITVKDTTVYPISAEIVGPDRVTENTSKQYQLQINYSNGTNGFVTADSWSFTDSSVGSVDNTGLFTAVADVESDRTGDLSATYTSEGETVFGLLEITVTDETDYPVSATILGNPVMSENTTQTLQLQVHYQSGAKVIEQVQTWNSSNSSAAAINKVTGVVTAAENIQVDAQTQITATFVAHGRTVEGVLDLTVRDTTNYPVSAVIGGPDQVDEGNQADYVLTVKFADGTEAQRSGVWTVNGAGAINANGKFTAPTTVDENTVTHINASFTLDGVSVSAPPKRVTIIDTTIYPVSARILGPNSVGEGESKTYQLEVLFSDSNTSVVPVTNWTSSNEDAGTISSAGVFHAKDVNGTQTTEISASYSSNGRTVDDNMVISVIDSTDYPVSAEVRGVTELDEGGTTSFDLYVTYTSGNTAPVDVTDWTSSVPSAGNIAATTGVFTATANLQADVSTQLRASYTAHGETVVGLHNLTVKDKTVYPVSAVVEGDALIDSLAQKQYSLRVTFEDDTSKVVDAVWTHSNPDAGTIDSDGLFTASENVSGANVSTILKGEYTLDGVSVYATRNVAVRDLTNYPTSVVVNGLSALDSSDENGAVSTPYTATVHYTDGTTQENADVEWSIDGVQELGVIDDSGLFITNPDAPGSSRSVTIRATYVEHGRTVTGVRSVNVTVIARPASLEILGPNQVTSESNTEYQARVTDSRGNVEIAFATFTSTAGNTVATMSESGTLSARRLTAETQIEVTAMYTMNGKEVSDTKTVTILKAVEYDRMEIAGDAEVESNGTNQLTVTGFYDDGTSADITSTVEYSVKSGVGQFNPGVPGQYMANNVIEDGAVTVEVKYTYAEVTYRETFTFNVKAPVVEPDGPLKPRYGIAMFADTTLKGGVGRSVNNDIPYTQWDGPQDFFNKVMTTEHDIEANDTVDFQMPEGLDRYFYYAVPKEMASNVHFYLGTMGFQFQGGFDGQWWTPEDAMEPYNMGGMEFVVDMGDGPKVWLLYRTDFPDHAAEESVKIVLIP